MVNADYNKAIRQTENDSPNIQKIQQFILNG